MEDSLQAYAVSFVNLVEFAMMPPKLLKTVTFDGRVLYELPIAGVTKMSYAVWGRNF